MTHLSQNFPNYLITNFNGHYLNCPKRLFYNRSTNDLFTESYQPCLSPNLYNKLPLTKSNNLMPCLYRQNSMPLNIRAYSPSSNLHYQRRSQGKAAKTTSNRIRTTSSYKEANNSNMPNICINGHKIKAGQEKSVHEIYFHIANRVLKFSIS